MAATAWARSACASRCSAPSSARPSTGIAAVAVRGSNHCGALAAYVLQAVAHDMIGMVTTNALPTMAPWGGAERLLGINPLGVGIPGGRGAADRVRRRVQRLGARQDPRLPAARPAAAAGLGARPRRAADDRPGRGDRRTAAADRRLQGRQPGVDHGHPVVDALGRQLRHGAGRHVRRPHAGQDGHFACAIRVDAFEELARFKARVDAAIRQLHDVRLAPGFERVYAPGEKEFLTEVDYRATASRSRVRHWRTCSTPLTTWVSRPGAVSSRSGPRVHGWLDFGVQAASVWRRRGSLRW